MKHRHVREWQKWRQGNSPKLAFVFVKGHDVHLSLMWWRRRLMRQYTLRDGCHLRVTYVSGKTIEVKASVRRSSSTKWVQWEPLTIWPHFSFLALEIICNIEVLSPGSGEEISEFKADEN